MIEDIDKDRQKEIDKRVAEEKKAIEETKKAAKEAAEESYRTSAEWIAEKKELNEISAQEEIELWERVSARYAEGTKQREDADKNLAKARKELRKEEETAVKEMQKLEDAYTKALDKRVGELFNASSTLKELLKKDAGRDKETEKAQSAVEKTKDSVEKAKDAYEKAEDALKKVVEQMNEAGLTAEKTAELQKKQAEAQKEIANAQKKLAQEQKEAAKAEADLTAIKAEAAKSQAAIMTESIEKQIAAMKNYEKQMAELAKKGLDEGLLKELRKMGPEANEYLEELNKSSKPELDKLSKAFQEEYELARKLAVEELEGLRKDTDEQIGAILDTLTQKMSSEANPVGANMIYGILEGIDENKSTLAETIESVMQGVIDRANETLGIHSPSKEFKDIGTYAGDGFVKGVEGVKLPDKLAKIGRDMINAAAKAISAEAGAMAAAMKNAMQKAAECLISLSPQFASLGKNMVQGLINGINSMKGEVAKSVTAIGNTAANGVKKALGIKSPSKVGLEIGSNFVSAIAEGLSAEMSALEKEIAKIDGIMSGVEGSFDIEGNITRNIDMSLDGVSAGAFSRNTGGVTNNQIDRGVTVNLNNYAPINSDMDIKKIALRLGDLMAQRERSRGLITV